MRGPIHQKTTHAIGSDEFNSGIELLNISRRYLHESFLVQKKIHKNSKSIPFSCGIKKQSSIHLLLPVNS